jgi:hypothetical protein
MKKAIIILSAIAMTVLFTCYQRPNVSSSPTENWKPTDNMPIDSIYIEQQKEELVEFSGHYVDSTDIGNKGYNKIELSVSMDTSDYSKDSIYIRFYSKLPNGKWHLKQEIKSKYDYIIDDCYMELEDFNNDGFKDMTYISAAAARGSNEVRKLFIYDKKTDELVYLKNSENYPNMRYNEELDCIDAYLVYGCQATVFLHIDGDSLKKFADVEICGNNDLTITEYDKKGNSKVSHPKFKGDFTNSRFKNYKPLKE